MIKCFNALHHVARSRSLSVRLRYTGNSRVSFRFLQQYQIVAMTAAKSKIIKITPSTIAEISAAPKM